MKKKVIQNNLLKLLYSNYENDNENLLQITDKPIMATNHGRTLAMDKPTMDINHGRTLAMEVEYFNFKPVKGRCTLVNNIDQKIFSHFLLEVKFEFFLGFEFETSFLTSYSTLTSNFRFLFLIRM